MGFSVSGSAAIIFVGLFIGFGMWQTATANSVERLSDARADRTDAILAQQNTDIEIVTASYGGGDLTVEVENRGATQLRRSETDLLIDGRYVADWQGGGSDLWRPGETVTIVRSLASQPDRVKVVTERGVADTSGVA